MGQQDQDAYQGAYSQDGPAYYDSAPTTERTVVLHWPGHQGDRCLRPPHPGVAAYLTDSAAALAPHETVSTSAKTRLLAVGQTTGPSFAVYDISDCRHPVLKATVDASSTSFHHMGAFAPDGKTFYVSQNFQGIGGFLYIVDVSDPANPKSLPPWQYLGDGRPHGLTLNPSGFLPGVPEGTLAVRRADTASFGPTPASGPTGW